MRTKIHQKESGRQGDFHSPLTFGCSSPQSYQVADTENLEVCPSYLFTRNRVENR